MDVKSKTQRRSSSFLFPHPFTWREGFSSLPENIRPGKHWRKQHPSAPALPPEKTQQTSVHTETQSSCSTHSFKKLQTNGLWTDYSANFCCSLISLSKIHFFIQKARGCWHTAPEDCFTTSALQPFTNYWSKPSVTKPCSSLLKTTFLVQTACICSLYWRNLVAHQS